MTNELDTQREYAQSRRARRAPTSHRKPFYCIPHWQPRITENYIRELQKEINYFVEENST